MKNLFKKPKTLWMFLGVFLLAAFLTIGSCSRRTALKQDKGGAPRPPRLRMLRRATSMSITCSIPAATRATFM